MLNISATERSDLINIILILISFCIAIIIPFELFLFSYAILGPLHYLTEISWLHDKNYFTKGRYDVIFLLMIGIITSIFFFNHAYQLGMNVPNEMNMRFAWIGLFSAFLFILVKGLLNRIVGILLIIVTSHISTHFWIILLIFLPTLIHVYVFTGLFMLYGALKSKSKIGIISVIFLLICSILLFYIYPDTIFFQPTEYSKNAYIGGEKYLGMISLHVFSLEKFFHLPMLEADKGYWIQQVFYSKTGILLARFIAFAYTYHYLNWFSKTRIIQWHKVPRYRFILVVVFWLISIGIYTYDYVSGIIWLFFLSYLHVLFELPLNFISIIGISKSIKSYILPYKNKQNPLLKTAITSNKKSVKRKH